MSGWRLEWHAFEALSGRALYKLLAFRQAIFVVEQASPYADLDGADFDAAHLIARPEDGTEIIGCARVLPPRPGYEPAFGRLAVHRDWRKRGLGRALVRACLDRLETAYPGAALAISAQIYLEDFYGRYGFRRSGPFYDDHGVPHIPMRRPGN